MECVLGNDNAIITFITAYGLLLFAFEQCHAAAMMQILSASFRFAKLNVKVCHKIWEQSFSTVLVFFIAFAIILF